MVDIRLRGAAKRWNVTIRKHTPYLWKTFLTGLVPDNRLYGPSSLGDDNSLPQGKLLPNFDDYVLKFTFSHIVSQNKQFWGI